MKKKALAALCVALFLEFVVACGSGVESWLFSFEGLAASWFVAFALIYLFLFVIDRCQRAYDRVSQEEHKRFHAELEAWNQERERQFHAQQSGK